MRFRPWIERKGFSIVGCFLAGALSVFLVQLVLAGWGKPLWSQEASGWAQAVGTVAAIIFAWWQGQRAQSSEDRRRRDATLRFLGHLAGFSHTTVAAAEESEAALRAANGPAFSQLAVKLIDAERALAVVGRIPIQDWPSPFLATALEAVHVELIDMKIMMTGLIADMGRGNPPSKVQHYLQRSEVFRFRLQAFMRQIAFQRAIHEKGPGPTIRFAQSTKPEDTGAEM